jgi:hypothetical protein
LGGKGGIKTQAHRAIAGQSDFQHEFDLINTFQPGPPEAAVPFADSRRSRRFGGPGEFLPPLSQAAPSATVRMVYNEGATSFDWKAGARAVCSSVLAQSTGAILPLLGQRTPKRTERIIGQG